MDQQSEMGWQFADDESVVVPEFKDEEVEDLSVDVYHVLQEEAVNAQRLAVARNATNYVKGSADIVTYDASKPMTDEKMFRVGGLIDWVDGDPDVVVDALRQGRVRARVSAKMGLGKSTNLPFFVAREMDHRVLYVTPEVNALAQNNRYLRRTGRGAIKRQWRNTVQNWVCGMSYMDFNANASASRRGDLFKHFETIIFDEASMDLPEVKAALKQFAVLALPHTNLLLCSATIREDEQGLQLKSNAQGQIRVLDSPLPPEAAMASGKLVSDYLVDRTMFVLPSDERVHDMAVYYEEQGVDVKTLDSASRDEEVEAIERWGIGDSVTPRVLVCHQRYACSYNFPVGFLLLWPMCEKMEMQGDEIKFYEKPMTQSAVNQATSRLGRGIVDGASGIVLSPERDEEGTLTQSEKLREFVILHASYVRPRRTAEWAECYTVFPNGLTAGTAQYLLKLNLPVEVAARFLAIDGKMASKYAKGLMAFSQSDHYVYPSAHLEPVGHANWKEEHLFGAPMGSAMIKVPIHTRGELQVCIQAIIAISAGSIRVDRWRVDATMAFLDGMDSDSDVEPTAQIQRRRLRRVRSVEKPLPTLPLSVNANWDYVAVNEALGGKRTRQATILPTDRFNDAMALMCSRVDKFSIGTTEFDYRETDEGTKGAIELPAGEIESPGGSIVCELPGQVCAMMNRGDELSVDQMKVLIQIFRTHGRRFVASRLFDGYGNPWSSVLQTMNNDEITRPVVHAGLGTFMWQFLSLLSGRFSVELLATVKHSNIFRSKYEQLFNKDPSPEKLLRQIRKGRFVNIAQTDGYMRRVLQLKVWIDEALLSAERMGSYLPQYITEAQRTLPIHPSTMVGNVGQNQMIPPASSRRGHVRYRSADYEWDRPVVSMRTPRY